MFGVAHDPSLKCALRNRKSLPEVLDYGSIGDVTRHIKETLDDELHQSRVASRSSHHDGDDHGSGSCGHTEAVDSDGGDGREEELGEETRDMIGGSGVCSPDCVDARAERYLSQYIHLIVEPVSGVALVEMLKDSPLGSVRAESPSTLLINFDTKASGETMSRPHLRSMPLQVDYLYKLTAACLQARGGQICTGDLYMFWDAGKTGNAAKFLTPFQTDIEGKRKKAVLPHDVKRLNVVASEASVANRRSKSRGFANAAQLEGLLIISGGDLFALPTKDRLHYGPGTTLGDVVGPVDLPPWHSAWRMPIKEKRLMYGERRVATGGSDASRGDIHVEDTSPVAPQGCQDTVPFNYFEAPGELYSELLHSLHCKSGVIDLTASSGLFAFECLKRRVPYVGVCFTERHMVALKQHLLRRLRATLLDATSPLHQPDLAMVGGVHASSQLAEDVATPGAKTRQSDGDGPPDSDRKRTRPRPSPLGARSRQVSRLGEEDYVTPRSKTRRRSGDGAHAQQ